MQLKKKVQPHHKSLEQVTLLTPEIYSATGPSTGTSLDSAGQDKNDLLLLDICIHE